MDPNVEEKLTYEIVHLSIESEDATNENMSSLAKYSFFGSGNLDEFYDNVTAQLQGAVQAESYVIQVTPENIAIADGDVALFFAHAENKTFIYSHISEGIYVALPVIHGQMYRVNQEVPYKMILTLLFRSVKEFINFRQALIDHGYTDSAP